MNRAGEESCRLLVTNPIFLVPDEMSQIQHQGAIPGRRGLFLDLGASLPVQIGTWEYKRIHL